MCVFVCTCACVCVGVCVYVRVRMRVGVGAESLELCACKVSDIGCVGVYVGTISRAARVCSVVQCACADSAEWGF